MLGTVGKCFRIQRLRFICFEKTSYEICKLNYFQNVYFTELILCSYDFQKMSESDFKKAFDTEENEDWRRAVIEATFIMNKDLDSRLVTFDTLTML